MFYFLFFHRFISITYGHYSASSQRSDFVFGRILNDVARLLIYSYCPRYLYNIMLCVCIKYKHHKRSPLYINNDNNINNILKYIDRHTQICSQIYAVTWNNNSILPTILYRCIICIGWLFYRSGVAVSGSVLNYTYREEPHDFILCFLGRIYCSKFVQSSKIFLS